MDGPTPREKLLHLSPINTHNSSKINFEASSQPNYQTPTATGVPLESPQTQQINTPYKKSLNYR